MRRRHLSGNRRRKHQRIVVTDVDEPGQRLRAALRPPVQRSAGSAGSNFYINPKEIFDYLENNHEQFYDDDGNIDLNAVRDWMVTMEMSDIPYERFWSGPRSDDGFVVNEYLKLQARPSDIRSRDWLFPHLSGLNGAILDIPRKDVFDLPIFLLLYILRRLSQFAGETSSFMVSYVIDDANDITSATSYPISSEDNSPITIIDGRISPDELEQIYLTVIRRFAALLPEGDATWNGTDWSGTRIMLLHSYGDNTPVRIRLNFTPTRSVSRGHGWTQEVEDLLVQNFDHSILSVRNKDDNKCLLYCLIMGLIVKIKGESRTFGRGNIMIESTEIYAKGMYLFNVEDDITRCIQKITKLLLPPVYSTGPVDPLVKMAEDIDKKAGTMISVREFRTEFKEIEKKLIPETICGVDVYGIDFNVNSHIYPLYISSNRDKIIELLCVTPLDTKCSHYCLITNKEMLFKNAGGKQFFSCSKCGQSFYHRRLLTNHKCPFTIDSSLVDGDYHFSTKDADITKDQPVGYCTKCRLCFLDQFSTEYHKSHCFMSNQTGYRHVQLVTYQPDEHPSLNGVEIDMDEEDRHVLKRRVMYADFESSINPETGAHAFMSYGIFDCDTREYKCGYDLKEFIDFILEKAYCNDEKDQIYVFFHNAMGYDANFILRYILKSDEYSNWGIQVIMKSMNRLQKLIFHVKEGNLKPKTIRIGDSFLFLTLSLDRIVGSIRKDDIEANKMNFSNFFQIFYQRYPGIPDHVIDHVLRKNIFPYKFFTDTSKLDTPISEFLAIFRPEEKNLMYFSEKVTLDDLSNGYNDTKSVMETFNCRNARDYHDLYLCCDVMQLTDVFNRSMEILWESHHIHLTKYLGMPSASWAAFLRFDPTMSIPLYENTFFAEFFKGMIRGGVTSAALRYAKSDENHSIIYLDVNGLYPYVMQAYKFPCGNFKFIQLNWIGDDVCREKLFEMFERFELDEKGMCYCVDMIIPDSVKARTDMYPFAPEHRKIFKEYYEDLDEKKLTPFLKKWSEANDDDKMVEFTGLVCTLYDKIQYNVHWRLLKFYMEHGVIIRKVHFGVLFDEGDYLAGYIRKNIAIRNTRKDELGKTLYKLLGNSIYGKTFESPFKRNTFEIVRDPIKLQGLMEEGNIAAITPIDDFAWIVRMDGENIILDKPTYIGACVCEFAKLHMYTLLYDKLSKIFPTRNGSTENGCQMVYTDTDSFIIKVEHPEGVEIKTPEDLFKYIKTKDPELLGGVGGQVKSETGEDDVIDEVIALRSKVYAYKTKNGHIGKRAKGTTHDAQEMQLDWETYKKALETLTSIDTKNVQFVRKTFKVASVDVFRQSLSVNDGKRFICRDGIHTHAFGFPLPPDELEEEIEEYYREEEEQNQIEIEYEKHHFTTDEN